MQNLSRVGKMTVQFEAIHGPEFMFWDDIGNPSTCQRFCPLSISRSLPEILALKVAIELRSRRK